MQSDPSMQLKTKLNNNKQVVTVSVVIESRFFEPSQSRVMKVRVRESTSFSPRKIFEFEYYMLEFESEMESRLL